MTQRPGLPDARVDPTPPYRRRRRRGVLLVGVLLAAVGVAAAAALGLGGRVEGEPVAARTGPAATVPVTRQTLVESVTLAGELSYGTPVPLACTAPGMVTWLPAPGATIRRGETLLRADEQPVLLLYGTLPMYRQLTRGTRGPDVRQFEKNLAALGYSGFTVDDEFTAVTAATVKRWQKDLGRSATGTVDGTWVTVAPGPIRVAGRLVRIGAAATGEVLSYTEVTRVVTVPVPAGQTGWATIGRKVGVILPGGATVAGRVTAVADEAQAAAGSGAPDPASPGTDGATVRVTIGIPDQKALGDLSRGPVDVRRVSTERRNVLTVPVAALLALAEGGYGLEVATPGGTRVVAVQVGLFADGRVEVSGDGIAEGTLVGVAQ